MNRSGKKKKSNTGFTLLESLMALLVVSLISAAIAAAVAAAVKSKNTVTDRANAEVLLSTCVRMLQNEFREAGKIMVSEDGREVSYFSGEDGKSHSIGIGTDGVMLDGERLIPEVMSMGLICGYERISLKDEVITFTGLSFSKEGRVLSETELKVRTEN